MTGAGSGVCEMDPVQARDTKLTVDLPQMFLYVSSKFKPNPHQTRRGGKAEDPL